VVVPDETVAEVAATAPELVVSTASGMPLPLLEVAEVASPLPVLLGLLVLLLLPLPTVPLETEAVRLAIDPRLLPLLAVVVVDSLDVFSPFVEVAV
jgi:hypothetical protein